MGTTRIPQEATGRRLAVLLGTEGTYPYKGGGVSTWCHTLCQELGEVDFHLFAVAASPGDALRYELPENVRQVHKWPLWGAEEPASFFRPDLAFADVYQRRRATTDAVVHARFVPLFKRLLRLVLHPGQDDDVGAVVRGLYRYFQQYDYKRTFRSEAAWDVFKDAVLQDARAHEGPAAEAPSLFDMTTAMRWLYHFLLPLSASVPVADVAHATIAGFSALPCIVARLEHGTPMVVTDHGVFARERYIAISSDDFGFFAKRFLMDLSLFVTRLCYAVADQVSPVCDYNRRWEVVLGAAPEKIQTIHNGIDTERFVPGPKPEKTRGRPTVVAATHLYALKDIETMIRSCDVARREVPDVHYLVYGSLDVDPAYTERCRALIRERGLEEHCTLAGFHDEPAALYKEGDLCVLSSISEGFPYTVIEAMACGRPVVATDVGGVREALEGCGVIVKPGDAEALGQGVARLLRDAECRQHLGQKARARVVARFQAAGSVEAYRETYRRLAGAGIDPQPAAGPMFETARSRRSGGAEQLA